MSIHFDVSEIRDRWPGELPYDDAYLHTQVKDALTELREHIPGLDGLVAAGTISQDSIDKIVSKAVIAVLRNPEGLRTESEGNYSLGRYGDGFVWFRQADIDRLLPRRARASWGWVS